MSSRGQRARSRVICGLLAAVILLVGGTADVSAAGEPEGRIVICHVRGDQPALRITVSARSEPAHRAHGDGRPGEAIASRHGFVWGEQCLPQGVDADDDGVLDRVDNCTLVANPLQADWNQDGSGDACQDYDGDTVLDGIEITNGQFPDRYSGEDCRDDSPELVGNARLQGCNLALRDLRSSSLAGADLYFADLSYSDLERSDLAGTRLERAQLVDARLQGVFAFEVNFRSADLRWADLSFGQFGDSFSFFFPQAADFSAADLTGADLTGADFGHAILAGAVLVDAVARGFTPSCGCQLLMAWADLTGADVESADLAGVQLTDVDLSGANFTRTRLAAATITGDFTGTTWRENDLPFATVHGLNLPGGDLRGFNLRGASLVDSNLEGADLTQVDLSGASFHIVDFAFATLTNANLSNLAGLQTGVFF